jgi:histone H3/H4
MTSARGSELASSIEGSIAKGATSVEKIHKSILDLPLRMLEESELLRRPAREVRRVQDRAIAAVYDTIRGINHQVGTLAAKLLKEAARLRGLPAEASARHHAAVR